MYLKASANPKFDPAVQTIQMKLNAINIQVHGNWPYLQADGLFGEKTKQAVKAFQVYRNITPISGEVGDTTIHYINDSYNNCPMFRSASPQSNSEGDAELLNIILDYFVKPISQMTVDFVTSLNQDYNKNSKQVVKDWNLIVSKARTRLLQLMSKFKKDKSIAYDKLKNYWDKKNKLSPYRNNKQQKYSRNIESLLDKHLGKNRLKLDYNKFIKEMKIGKTFGAFAKRLNKIELGIALGAIVGDINNINDSVTWMSKWTNDINKLIDVLVGIIVGAIVVFLLPEELSVLVVCLIVGAVGILVDFLLKCFHKSYLGQKFDPIVGEISSDFIRDWQREADDIRMENKRAEEEWIKSQGYITISTNGLKLKVENHL